MRHQAIKFLEALILLSMAVFLQLTLGEVSGVWINFPFAALIALSFFLGFWELVITVLIAVFLLNWQPSVSLEMVILAAFPLLSLWLHKLLPWQIWLSTLVAIFVGFLILYLSIGAVLIVKQANLFLIDLFGGLVYGILVSKLMEFRK